eukprot:CAMPEP_0182814996 /NCGR_PEP_ID=MMETSP0006_2-20121128/10155_1 /TAXON_ID=97485 /ORGANISM="Prymnesium parvum, Strain Texoma1" /LENGTH=70 /DNA_ID=CAMNT_0024941165 /DNA_START=175 /DNA_END=387 /DNA_ORIENTATION=+
MARRNATFFMGLSRCEYCCVYMAPKCMRAEQHVRDRESIAPTNEEKSTETKPSTSPPVGTTRGRESSRQA